MGLPNIIISFSEAAETAVLRSGRGVVCLLLDDTEDTAAFERFADNAAAQASDWSEQSKRYMAMAFRGGAAAVLAVRAGEDAGAALAGIAQQKWNWLASPIAGSAETLVTFIKAARAKGATYKAVVANANAPQSEGIVNFCSGAIVTGAGTVTAAEYSVKLAGVFAGLAANRSATYLAMDDVLSAEVSADPGGDIDSGKLILIYDGAQYKIGRAVTSRTTGAAEFRKIKTVEGADMITADLKETFAENYIGKVVNDYDSKQLLVSAVNSYLAALGGTVLDGAYRNCAEVDYDAQLAYLTAQGYDVSGKRRSEILMANTGSEVFLALHVKFLDAMEDMTISAVLQ